MSVTNKLIPKNPRWALVHLRLHIHIEYVEWLPYFTIILQGGCCTTEGTSCTPRIIPGDGRDGGVEARPKQEETYAENKDVEDRKSNHLGT